MVRRTCVSFLSLLSIALAVQVFEWPDHQLSELDEALFHTNVDFTRPGNQVQFLAPCVHREISTVSAQWLRIAYHDMATHDVSDGSGGLDASIRFELDRPQNIGIGMRLSLEDFSSVVSPFISMADVIAMGVVTGVLGCFGPVIPYKYGRIDAKEPGPPTVPEPQQPLESHIESFRRQGFTPSEMINLVACGHTIGMVRRQDFPTVIQDESKDFAFFDGTQQDFDETVATEYLNSTTQNILVMGPNVTTRSDARIFSSDGNITMHSISTPASFAASCKSLLTRMIDTVPRDVNLKGPLEPIENKVGAITLSIRNGHYVFNTTLRTLSNNVEQNATLFWQGRRNSTCPTQGCAVQSSTPDPSSPGEFRIANMVPSVVAKNMGTTSMRGYFFSTEVPVEVGLSKFSFTVGDGSNQKTLVDNNGKGFIIEQDTLLHDADRSFLYRLPQDDPSGSNFKLVFGVKENVASSPSLSLILQTFDPSVILSDPNATDPLITNVTLKPDDLHNVPEDGYRFFTANISKNISAITASATVDGKTFATYVRSGEFAASTNAIAVPSHPS